MMPLALLYILISLVLGVMILSSYFKMRHLMWRYSGMAMKYSLGLTLLGLTTSGWIFWLTGDSETLGRSVVGVLLQWPLMYIYLSVGVRHAKKIGLPGSLFWKHLARVPFSIDYDDSHLNPVIDLKDESGHRVYASTLKPEYLEVQSVYFDLSDSLSPKWWAKYDGILALSVALGSIYTVVLFRLTSPQASEMIRVLQDSTASSAEIALSPVLLIMIFSRLAIMEELFFRLAGQTYMEWRLREIKFAPAISIIFISLFWSLGHMGVLVPEWVKFAQIFPFGIALGVIYRRFGIEAAAIIHVAFNIAMIFLTPGLLNF